MRITCIFNITLSEQMAQSNLDTNLRQVMEILQDKTGHQLHCYISIYIGTSAIGVGQGFCMEINSPS